MSDEQMETVLDLHHYLLCGQPLLRDQRIPSRNSQIAQEENVLILDDSDDARNNSIQQNYGAEAVWQLSQQSQSLLDADSDFRKANNISQLQRSIIDMAKLLKQGSNNKYQTLVGLAGEIHRLTEDDEDDHNTAVEQLMGLVREWTKKKSSNINSSYDTCDNVERLHLAETGHYRQNREKRKKTMGK